ncbi:MAG TPA: enoyl-CoA hydratase-related protein [Polyangiaceae bacterium]|nr:enoyl-CoA hydratase-related protein [Polyangiaceae bacterium]
MSERLVKLTMTDGVAQVTLDRPARRNALTRDLLAQLSATVAEAAANPATRLVVLDGSGPAFCAGMDLDEMQQRASAPDARAQWEQDASAYRDALVAILRVDMPTLAVVHAPAIAGGFGIVLACDLVLATPNAKFSLPEVKRGISPAVVSPLLLYRIGNGPAMPLLLEGRTINGEEAYRLGICHYLSSPERLVESRQEIVAALLTGAPQALAVTKRLVRSFALEQLIQQLEAGRKVSAEARASSEAREGLAAFREKREPKWVVR